MTGINRDSLKQRFRTGRMPTEEDFSILVDSMVNLVDEGFSKTGCDGMRIDQISEGKLLSFYENLAVHSPQWFLQMGPQVDGERPLHLSPKWSTPGSGSLSLARMPGNAAPEEPRLAVGVNTPSPQHELDVVGTIRSHRRLGRSGWKSTEADGQWHTVTDPMTGCNALEIVAGTGATEDPEGKYALVHAIAIKAFGSKGSISVTQSNYGSGCSRIQIRWRHVDDADPQSYVLQIRTHCRYDSGGKIRYHVTELWDDPSMLECASRPSRATRR